MALNRRRHLCSAGRPSRWALAHILVSLCNIGAIVTTIGFISNVVCDTGGSKIHNLALTFRQKSRVSHVGINLRLDLRLDSRLDLKHMRLDWRLASKDLRLADISGDAVLMGVSLPLYICMHLLWPPYVIGQAIIFLPCGLFLSFLFFFFFPRLISAASDWMSTIDLTHGVALVRIQNAGGDIAA